MDYIREWVLRIAGIIILISACDMIMLEGEMKKYIKPILGIILVITVARPVFGDILDRFDVLTDYSTGYDAKLLTDTEERQQQNIKRIYEKRLSEEAQKLILDKYGIQADTYVTAKEKTSDFGELESIKVTFENEMGRKISEDELKTTLEKNMGVSKDKITVLIGS